MSIDYQKLRREQKIAGLSGLPLLLKSQFRNEISQIENKQREYVTSPEKLILALGRKQPIKSSINYEFK